MSDATRYSKRQRKEIKYYVSDEEREESDYSVDVTDGENDAPKNKKRKLSVTKVSQKPLPRKQIFPFLSLPAELRNKIYELALTDVSGHYIIAKTCASLHVTKRVSVGYFNFAGATFQKERRRAWRHQETRSGGGLQALEDNLEKRTLVPRILQVNKAVYEEAVGFLYCRPFVLSNPQALHDFLTQIGPIHRAMLRNVGIAEWGYTASSRALNYPAMALLAEAVSLESVMINVCYREGGMAKKIFRDCSAFLIRWGAAKGRADAAVDILHLPNKDDDPRPWQDRKCPRTAAQTQATIEDVRRLVQRAR